MDSKTISDLAKLLRKDGDKVLNEKCRLTLSTQILQDLNEAFSLIAERDVYNTTFQVIPSNNMNAEIFLDLQFLHDFVQKTLCLSVVDDVNGGSNRSYNVSISKFRNLRSLEVHKVPILQIRGVQSLRAQLQSLTCIRCVDNIKDILSACGADHSTGFVWSELKEAKFCYNNLQSIDSSLEYLPWLQVLDLSHNRIITAEALKWLPNLKYINLSYNKLEEIPMFHVDSSRKLQILKISNNDIEALMGVNRLEALCELDLANNYILDHSSLIPVSYLPNLRWLTLAGNPLAFHPEHRKLTAKYLHKNAGTFKFCLDQLKLTKLENSLTGSYKIAQRMQRSPRRHLNSVSSTQSTETSASESTCSEHKITESNVIERLKPIKPVKVRNALIVDIDDDDDEMGNDDNQTDRSNTDSLHDSMISTSESIEDTTHLEAKRQLSDLRSQFGDAWLHSQGGSLVQHVLGMTPLVARNPVERNLAEMNDVERNNDEAVARSLKNNEAFNVPLLSSTPNHDFTSIDSSQNNTLYRSTIDDESSRDDSTSDENGQKSGARSTEYNSVISDNDNVNNVTYDEYSDADSDNGSEEHTYLAQLETNTGNLNEVFVIVTEKCIKECSILSGKTLTKWSLSTLLSCERTNSSKLTICFDTVRRDRNQRKYILEHQDDAQRLDSHLREILSARPLQEMNQIVLRCMKCSMQFTKEIKQIMVSRLPNEKSESTPCPACHSKLVVEIEEDSPIKNHDGESKDKTKSNQKDNTIQTNQFDTGQSDLHLPHSKSQSSIGSATSLEDSITDSTVSVAGSDIEVLSNPSQSSIEVLHRKRSSEERRLMAYPSLNTIHDVVQHNNAPKSNSKSKNQNLLANTLTESSSSGSMTNSVCTAIENDKKSETSTPQNGITSPDGFKSTLSSSPSIISSMLEGLLQSANNLMTKKTDDSKNRESSDDEKSFTYSYQDFSIVDHRLTLHLYQNIFTDANEVLKWLVRCEIVLQNMEKCMLTRMESCVVMTSTRLYILKIVGAERGDEPEKWLVKYQSYQIHRLLSINILPYKQGISFTIEHVKDNSNVNVLCLLKDVQRTNMLLAYLSENKISNTCEIDCVVPAVLSARLQKVLSEEKTSSSPNNKSTIMTTVSGSDRQKHNLQLFMLFNSFDDEGLQLKTTHSGCILITTDDIIVSEDLSWLFADLDNEFLVTKKQPMMNLIEIDISDRDVSMHFLDESKNSTMETWKIRLETRNSVEILISAIRQPWEKLFLVPLTVNI